MLSSWNSFTVRLRIAMRPVPGMSVGETSVCSSREAMCPGVPGTVGLHAPPGARPGGRAPGRASAHDDVHELPGDDDLLHDRLAVEVRDDVRRDPHEREDLLVGRAGHDLHAVADLAVDLADDLDDVALQQR